MASKLFPKRDSTNGASALALESMEFDLDDLKDAETLNEKRSSLDTSTATASVVQEDDPDAPAPKTHPMHLLVKAAELLNPMQYELPKELQTSFVIPGTSKRKWKTDGRKWIEITPKQKQVVKFSALLAVLGDDSL